MKEVEFRIEGLGEDLLRRASNGGRSALGLGTALMLAAAVLVPPPVPIPPPQERIQVIPLSLSFPDQQVGTLGPEVLVRLKNLGAPGIHPDYLLTGTHPEDFRVEFKDCEALPAGAECAIRIAFFPRGAGSRTAGLDLTATDDSTAHRQILLAGNGTIDTPPPVPILSVEPRSLDFDSLPLDSTSPSQPVRLTNSGGGTLHIEHLTLAGNEFRISSADCLHRDLGAGETCEVNLLFAPRVAGLRQDGLEIGVPAPAVSHKVNLSGTGLKQGVLITPGALSFLEQETGVQSEAQGITISSVGNTQISVGRITLAGQDARSFKVEDSEPCQGRVLTPNASCAVRVYFVPRSEGLSMASLNIAGGAASTLGGVALSGMGIAKPSPHLEVNPTLLDFTEPNPRLQRVVIGNSGAAPLSLSELTVAGPNARAFGVKATDCLGQVIAPGRRCTIQVQLVDAISQRPERSAELIMTHNADARPAKVQIQWRRPAPDPPGPAPQLTADRTLVDYGAVQLQLVHADRPAESITFTNTGTVPIPAMAFHIGPLFTSQRAFAIEINGCNRPLEPTGTCRISVSFGPLAAKEHSQPLVVMDERLRTLATVELRGRGQQPVLYHRRGPGE